MGVGLEDAGARHAHNASARTAGRIARSMPLSCAGCAPHGTIHFMRKLERRRRRASTITEALVYQLDACRTDGKIQAMVVADGDGLPLAASGDRYACDEVAARVVLVGPRIKAFDGVLLGDGERWDVQMTKVSVDGSELLVCAVGGTPQQRARQIKRGAAGAMRILTA
jgi:hypothetical protein